MRRRIVANCVPRALRCAVAALLLLPAAALAPPAFGQDTEPPLTRRVSVESEEAYYFFTTAGDNSPRPLLVVVPSDVDPARGQALSSWKQMEIPLASSGWRLLIPSSPKLPLWSDWGALAVREMIEEESRRGGIDASRIYLLGVGGGTPAAFSLVSRLSDIWAAAVAVNGAPKLAIDAGNLFAANAASVPFLWVAGAETQQHSQSVIAKLKAVHFPVNITTVENLNLGQVLSTFETRRKDLTPATVDFETDSPLFTRCYWVEIAALDLTQRNDVLGQSRVKPGSGAGLSIGPFGYNAAAPGPGVVVGWLPEKYSGPLKLNDRIVSIRGKEVSNAYEYQTMMDSEEQPSEVSIMVERDGKRSRTEGRIVLPSRVIPPSARVKAEKIESPPGIQVISRGVSRLRLHVPKGWAPTPVNWNGVVETNVENDGCWELTLNPDAKAVACPQPDK